MVVLRVAPFSHSSPALKICPARRAQSTFCLITFTLPAFPGGAVINNPPADAGEAGSIPGSGGSPGGGNGYPRRSSCLENPMNREAWQATVHGVVKGRAQLTKQKWTFPTLICHQQVLQGMETEVENCVQEVHWASSQRLINPWKTEIALMCGSEIQTRILSARC